MPHNKSEAPIAVTYILVLAVQFPVWLGSGLLWGAFMVALAGWHPVTALVGGLGWGFVMWVVVGNFIAVGLAWRRSVELPSPDQAVFRTAIKRACGKLRLAILVESADEVVLGPKRALLRFRMQEVRVKFVGDVATLTAPALSFGAVRKQLRRALAVAPVGEQQK